MPRPISIAVVGSGTGGPACPVSVIGLLSPIVAGSVTTVPVWIRLEVVNARDSVSDVNAATTFTDSSQFTQ